MAFRMSLLCILFWFFFSFQYFPVQILLSSFVFLIIYCRSTLFRFPDSDKSIYLNIFFLYNATFSFSILIFLQTIMRYLPLYFSYILSSQTSVDPWAGLLYYEVCIVEYITTHPNMHKAEASERVRVSIISNLLVCFCILCVYAK
jgi:hypothetical protein